jgi:hypothetical protein
VFEYIFFLRRVSLMVGLASTLAAFAEPHSSYAETSDAFRVPKAEFRAAVRTIAVEPLRVEERMPASAELRRSIEATIQSSLSDDGFRVVPPATVDAVRRAVVARFGGLYDPVTGLAEPQRRRTADQLIASELARVHGADAILTPVLHYDSISPELRRSGLGLSASVYALGEPVPWRGQPMTTSDAYPQRIDVSAVAVRIRDLTLGEMYAYTVPIEWTRIYARRTYQKRAGGELQRPDAIRAAVERVLAPLGNDPAPGASESAR